MFLSREDLLKKLAALPSDRAPAFIAGLGPNGLTFLRSLGRRGLPLVALDSWKDPAMYSRYGMAAIVPHAEEEPAELLRFLLEVGEATPVRGVLIPTSDALTLFVSKHAKDLSRHFYFSLPDYETVLTVADKSLQYEYAQEQGVGVPLTLSPVEDNIEDVAREMRYPCIIKPHFSHLWWQTPTRGERGKWGKVGEANSASELINTYTEMRKSGLEFTVQERVGGGDDQLYTLMAYLDRASHPIAIFTKRKLRQFPPGAGDTSLQVGVWEPEVAELGLRLLQGLRFRGNAGVEFKRDPRDGELKLIEINPRSLATIHNAVTSGVDFPYITYRDAQGEKTEEIMTFREGIKWISFAKDLKAFRAYRRSGDLSLGRWMRSLAGDRHFAFFAWDDPFPALRGMGEFAIAELRGGG